jgi:hypothetical protein
MEEFSEISIQELKKIARKPAVPLGHERQGDSQRGNRVAHIRDIEECRGSTRREGVV